MPKKANKVQEAALRLLTFRDRSRWELAERLKRRFSPAEVEKVVSDLAERGYLDDLRFARNYVDYRNRNRPRGNYLLRLELAKKGIVDSIIEQVLNPEELEYELALALVQERLGGLEGVEPRKRAQRLYSLLERRGFPRQVARSVLGDLLDSDPQKEYN